MFFSVLDRRYCATCWGRDLKWVCNWCLWKISPTLILVPAFIPKEDNTNKDSTGFELPGSQIFYWGKVHEMLKWLSFFLLLFSLYVYSFYYGKLGIMGNFAGWRNEWGCTRYVESLPDGTYQSLNKHARVKLYIHKAKLCTSFCLAPCVSVSLLDKGGLYEC